MKDSDIVIVGAKRTPLGNLQGALSTIKAHELGALSLQAALTQASLDSSAIDEVIYGCVLQAGQGQAPARQAALLAGLPYDVGATTVNKMCGSGMKAVMLAFDAIKAGSAKVVLAGGMESMSNAPYLLTKARGGYRLGHGELKDSLFLDGLEDAYDKGKLMGVYAEETATKYQFSRETQDYFAQRSLQRALTAARDGKFREEIVPVKITSKSADMLIDKDEGPDERKLAKIPRLKPVFAKDGTVTAANSSSISDGAASLTLTNYATAKAQGLTPLAKLHGHASFAQAPAWFTTAPSKAIQHVLDKCAWAKSDISLYEINEAFAVVSLAAIEDLALDQDKVNIFGGACALGHPIGASGARILVTLCYALKPGEKGIASLCIGGGEATAVAIERL